MSGELRSPAVELFFDRLPPGRIPDARQTDQLALIEQICLAVDGLPLAIELAAARHRAFSLTQIADQVRLDPAHCRRSAAAGLHHRHLRSAINGGTGCSPPPNRASIASWPWCPVRRRQLRLQP